MNTTEWNSLPSGHGLEEGDGRSAGSQAGYQLIAAAVTLAFAIVGGSIVGR